MNQLNALPPACGILLLALVTPLGAQAPAYSAGWDITEPVAANTSERRRSETPFPDVPQPIWRDRPGPLASVPQDFALTIEVEAREPIAAQTVLFREIDFSTIAGIAAMPGPGSLEMVPLSDTIVGETLSLQLIPLGDTVGKAGPALVLWTSGPALPTGARRSYILRAAHGGGPAGGIGSGLQVEVDAKTISIGNSVHRWNFDPAKNAITTSISFVSSGKRIPVSNADGLNGGIGRTGQPGTPLRIRLGTAATPTEALGCVLDVPGTLPLSKDFGVEFHLRHLFLAGSPVVDSWMRFPRQSPPERIISIQLLSYRLRTADFPGLGEAPMQEDVRLRGPNPARLKLASGTDAFGLIGHRLSLLDHTDKSVTFAGGWSRGRADGRTHPWTGEEMEWHTRLFAGSLEQADSHLRSLAPYTTIIKNPSRSGRIAAKADAPAARAAIEVLLAAADQLEGAGAGGEASARRLRETADIVAKSSASRSGLVAVQREGFAVLSNADAAFLIDLHKSHGAIRAIWSPHTREAAAPPIVLAEDPQPLWNLRVIEGSRWAEWSALDAQLTEARIEQRSSQTATLHLAWERAQAGSVTQVRATLTLDASSPRISAHLETGALPRDVALWEVDFPVISGVGKGRADRAGAYLAIPHWTGIRLEEPGLRTFTPDGMLYPGAAGWQFLTYYADGAGFYLGAHDERGHQKRYRHDPEGDSLSLRYTHLPPDMGRSGAAYTLPYPCIFGPHDGDWFDAVQIYREFLLPTPWFPKKTLAEDDRLPRWFKEAPLCVRIFSGDVNQEISSFLRPNLELIRALGSPETLIQWYGWNDTKPHMVARPEQRPDPKFPDLLRQFTEAGHHVFPYTCALLWDIRNPSFKKAGGEGAAKRDLDGNIVMTRYGGQPLAMVSPVNADYQRLMESVMKTILDNITVPGVYFDMFGTASGGHYLAKGEKRGGNNRTLGLRELARRYKGLALERNPNFVMWMEGNSDCFYDLIDGYISFQGNLPMRSAIYGEFRRPFGDKTSAIGPAPLELWHPACQFAWGAPVGRVFDRELFTDAAKTVLDPSKVAYYRNLVAHRASATPWLAYGRMLRPLERRNVVPAEPDGVLPGDSVPHAVWRAPDGTVAFVFANARLGTSVRFSSKINPAEYDIPTDGTWSLYRLSPAGDSLNSPPLFTRLHAIGGTTPAVGEQDYQIDAAGVLVLVARPGGT